MPHIKKFKLQNIEQKEKSLAELVEETKTEIKEGGLNKGKEGGLEIDSAEKARDGGEQVLAENIGKQANAADLASAGVSNPSDVQLKYKKREQQVEQIMSAGLNDIYAKMPPNKQQEFKLTGEETARKINILLSKAKVKTKEIIGLIRKWFLIIPGVNKFFLEQEAKIKADEIIKLKE